MLKKKEELLNKVINSINNLTAMEEEVYNYVNRLDEVEWRIRDILHYLEVTPITRAGAIELIDELQNLRIERRYIKQMWELWNVYGKNRMKLCEKGHRDFLITELHKEDKSLQTTYNFRQYTKEQLDAMNEDKSLPRKRKGEIISTNELFSSYNNNEEEEFEDEKE